MSFPASLTTQVVKGRFVTIPDGKPARGSARIVLENLMQGPSDDCIVAPFDSTFRFDGNGEIAVVLPSNNDPQWTPGVYRIVITIDDKITHRQKFDVPYNGSGVLDLADILNVPAGVPGQSYILLSSRGVSNGVASLDSAGRVPLSQMPAGVGGAILWTDIEDIPDTFPPSAHAHAYADVTGKPSTFTPSAHNHALADVTGLTDVLSDKADLVGGVVPSSQMPSIAIIDFLGNKANEAAMLASTGEKGDWCIRTDLSQAWVITDSDPSQLSSWTAIPLGTVAVQSVNGQTGIIVLGKADVGLGNVTNTSDANKPISALQQAALDLKAALASPTFTGTVAGITAAMVGLSNVTNTSDANKPVSTAQQTALDQKLSVTGDDGFTLSNGAVVLQQTPTRVDVGFSNGAIGAGFEVYKSTDGTRPGDLVALVGGLADGEFVVMHYDDDSVYTPLLVMTLSLTTFKNNVTLEHDLSVTGFSGLHGTQVTGDLQVTGYTSLQGVSIAGDVQVPNLRVTSGTYIDGPVYYNDVLGAGVIVLGAEDDVPEDTPTGTVIVRTT